MKSWLVGTLTISALCTAWAQDVGRVLSSTPILQQVSVPQRVCSVEQVSYQQANSGAGVALGAIAGGLLGNSIGGRGGERAVATIIGAVGGAVIGDRVEGPGGERIQNVERCTVQNYVENRTTGYQVLYEFGGRQYSVQMPQDPGPTIAVQVSPANAVVTQAPLTTTIVSSPAPVYIQPSVTYVTVPAPSVYYPIVRYRPLMAPTVVVPWGYGHRDRHFWR
jgi:uncharacterized protein YcfJ